MVSATMLGRIRDYLRPDKTDSTAQALLNLTRGARVVFSRALPLASLAGREAEVANVRHYRFGEDSAVTYRLTLDEETLYHITVAEDGQGIYLALSRELLPEEWADWFNLDVLDFFLTPTSARVLKLKPDYTKAREWFSPQYQKVLDAISGTLRENDKAAEPVQYTLLASENGERAIEIEYFDQHRQSRLFATLYRPYTDIVAVHAAAPARMQESAKIVEFMPLKQRIPEEAPSDSEASVLDTMEAIAAAVQERPVKPDFRRVNTEMKPDSESAAITPPLPSFLLEPQMLDLAKHAISLDDILPIEPERVRCDAATARDLIEEASRRMVSVGEMIREVMGLALPMRDDVLFEVALTEEDYKELAMRYHMKASKRDELRKRMTEELQRWAKTRA
jgi:hypothetical protein